MVATDPEAGQLAAREQAAAADRHWVRLTRCCNNRCLFCLDSEAQDGTVVAEDEVVRDIRRGAELGRRRLVLSGGEPTIHPAFLELVAEGRRAGYDRVQVVTNGRMLAAPGLLEAALEAGLGELTVSLHGHRAELHDRLVAVPGAFAQTVKALTAALADGRPVVNVDVVVCRQNVAHLEAILAMCIRLGVREYDLLQVQPAGRAAAPGSTVLYDPAEAAPVLRRVFALSRRPDLFLWTNRFPIAHLEGFERLAQDPHKLEDEVRGRAEHVERLLREGRPLPCRGERCGACFLEPLCDHLHGYAARLAAAGFDELLVDLRSSRRPPPVPERLAGAVRLVRVEAPSVEELAELEPGSLPGRRVALWLERADRLEDDGPLEVAGLPVVRLGSESPAVLERGAALGLAELEVGPCRATEGWLREHRTDEGRRIVVRPAPRSRPSGCLALDLAPDRLARLLAGSRLAVEDLPPCLAGGRPVAWTEPPLEPETTGGADGPVDAERLVARFAARRYRARSLRCARCAEAASCRGWDVQRVRAFGLRRLVPVSGGS